jgi:ubiquinone/menaquinone biosynthesis C-methylase UbiE
MFSSFTGRLIPKAIVFCADNSQDAAFAEKLKNALPNTDISISFGNGSNQFENDSFDIAVVRSLNNIDSSLELFFEVFRILKPSGNFHYFNAVRTFEVSEKLNSNLMISGFADTVVTQEDDQALVYLLYSLYLYLISCYISRYYTITYNFIFLIF